ncbi:hypothetical protein MTR67_045135 [Solanum verrucosum]|uniref:RNase H type-1 domain-containing protein n=1 Tax=Solanum verrucosum TaxID=315347 RepID=A0AAF0UTH7_SOLVR|nr:hypothetical protein MTR67_045135 [Solanum verrucosum]
MKAELIAFLQGLRIALERGLVPLEVNVDCKEIKTLIRGEHPTYGNILFDCRDLLHRLGNPPVHHIFRETNQVADALAKEGAKMDQINSFLCFFYTLIIVVACNYDYCFRKICQAIVVFSHDRIHLHYFSLFYFEFLFS